MRDSGISCGALGVHDAKWIVTRSGAAPLLRELVIVERDHGVCGPAAAFFKESMRRDAIVGTRIVFTLWDAKLGAVP